MNKLLGLAALSFLLPAAAYSANVPEKRMCGTYTPSFYEAQQMEEKFRFDYEIARTMNRTAKWAVNRPITVPVRFNVIYKTVAGKKVGNVPKSQLTRQVKVLNDSFKGSGIEFKLAGIKRVSNKTWFDGCMDNNSLESQYKKKLSVDPKNNLNIYVCDSQAGILGYAYFPSSFAEDNYRHGVVMKYDTLPGNESAHPYGAGKTAVHEVGHYFGLYHTFANGSCSGNGDFVSDTPFEKRPAYGCPVASDSCGTKIGKDPVLNYMDYSDDDCMNMFSNGQINRMQKQIETYKPSLL